MITRYRHREIAMRINAVQFRAKCLKLIDEVAATRKPIIITKRGKALVKLVPIQDEKLSPLFGYMKGTAQILGDIVNVPHDPWAAETGEDDELYAATPPKKKAAK
jgi:prevent-host-death family protein